MNNIQYVHCQRWVRREKHPKHILSVVWPAGNEQQIWCTGFAGMNHQPSVLVLKRPTDSYPGASPMWRGWCYECTYETQYWYYGATLGAMLYHRQEGCGISVRRTEADKARLPFHGRAFRDVGKGWSGEVVRPSDVSPVLSYGSGVASRQTSERLETIDRGRGGGVW